MIKLRIFLYDGTKSEYLGQELTEYLIQEDNYTEDLTEELDTAQFVLEGYPSREEFAPTTKFIVLMSDDTVSNRYELMVSTDTVNQTILSDNTKFTHTISFYEPSVVAQKRIVDNFSVSYKLKDVTLDYEGEEDASDFKFKSGRKYSVLSFVQKAIVNTGTYEKVNNIAVFDVNHKDLNGNYDAPYPFYIDEEFVPLLDSIDVVENIYNGKNLWEIFLESGKYIHAIPSLRFGKNDKFMLTYDLLGVTDESTNTATQASIVNFKGVEDYVSACSSYVTNMVQLGGEIEEWLAPKAGGEDGLVYNDSAILSTSRPITEIVEFGVKCNKQYKDFLVQTNNNNLFQIVTMNVDDYVDLTPYIFEKSIYDLLSPNYKENYNKGIALYYRNGTNTIDGLTYMTPSIQNGQVYDCQTIKKIIFCAFYNKQGSGVKYPLGYCNNLKLEYRNSNDWKHFYINDFTFYIRYRTKSSVRQHQTRPDIRKYLLNSKFDITPKFEQFYNQQDILVDSYKFGNNVYGTLARSGNKSYKCTEWVTELSKMKHKGQLYRINDGEEDGGMYYVAKAEHTIYATHIESVITYSKDYNKLSEVVGIPSEPRFYEISDTSRVNRDIEINDYLILTDTVSDINYNSNYLFSLSPIADIIFHGTVISGMPKYALTVFKGDDDTTLYYEALFGQKKFFKEVLSTVGYYSSQNTLTFEWEMADNFSAGNKVAFISDEQYESISSSTTSEDKKYRTIEMVKYCDDYGKASLFDFYLLTSVPDFTSSIIYNLPLSPITSKWETGRNKVTITLGGILRDAEGYAYIEVTTNGAYFPKGTFFVYQGEYGEAVDNIPVTGEIRIIMGGKFYEARNTTIEVYPTVKNKSYIGFNGFIASNVKSTTVNANMNKFGLTNLKDSREAEKFDYNLMMITSSDTFVTTNNLFLTEDKSNPRIVFLKKELNKLSNGVINSNDIIEVKTETGVSSKLFNLLVDYDYHTSGWGGLSENYIRINIARTRVDSRHFSPSTEPSYERVKAIAIIYLGDTTTLIANKNYKYAIGRNIPSSFDSTKAKKDWYIGGVNKSQVFRNKQ